MKEIKAFNIRISKELWRFLKKMSLEKEESMNHIVNSCLEEYKNRCKNKMKENVDKV